MGKTMEKARENKLFLSPLATYPGKFKPKFRDKARYYYSAKAVGEKKYRKYFPRVTGFHYHYELPIGMFNKETQFLNNPPKSRVKKTMIDSYNFLIAADPVLTTLLQSSPFSDGKYFAKDTRMLFWRGGKKLKFPGALDKHQMLGGLQPYKQTVSDLIATIKRKDEKMRILLKKAGIPQDFIDEKHVFDLMWNPIKINKIGTLEQRGLDCNYPSNFLGVSVLIKYILRAIQQDFYHVMPSDIGTDEPFKLEGNIIFVPPHTHVRNTLQYKSAYEGLGSDEIYKSAIKFHNLARKLVYKEYLPAIKPIKKMLTERKTVSDKAIAYVKKKGCSLDEPIPQEICQSLSLLHAKRLEKDIEESKKVYENLT
jgi:carboxylate-amine ligase